MSWCDGSDGVRILERLRGNDPTLRELDLSLKGLGDRDAVALGEALANNDALKALDLKQNSVGSLNAKSAGQRKLTRL